jgi:hypothetical protein
VQPLSAVWYTSVNVTAAAVPELPPEPLLDVLDEPLPLEPPLELQPPPVPPPDPLPLPPELPEPPLLLHVD